MLTINPKELYEAVRATNINKPIVALHTGLPQGVGVRVHNVQDFQYAATWIDAERFVGEPGVIFLSEDQIKAFKDLDEITINHDKAEGWLAINSPPKTKTRIKQVPEIVMAVDPKTLSVTEPDVMREVPHDEFRALCDAVSRVAPFAHGVPVERMNMAGVHVADVGDQIRVTATNSHALGQIRINYESEFLAGRWFTIPIESVGMIDAVLKSVKVHDVIKFGVGGQHNDVLVITVQHPAADAIPHTRIEIVTIRQAFPDLSQALSTVDYAPCMNCDHDELVSANRMTRLFVDKNSYATLSIDEDGQCSLSAKGSMREDTVNVVLNGAQGHIKKFKTAYNPAYLSMVLSASESGVSMWSRGVDHLAPLRFEAPNATFLIMPIRPAGS